MEPEGVVSRLCPARDRRPRKIGRGKTDWVVGIAGMKLNALVTWDADTGEVGSEITNLPGRIRRVVWRSSTAQLVLGMAIMKS
jgi:hypothetical protein